MSNLEEFGQDGGNRSNLKEFGIAAGVTAVAIGALATWAKMDPEGVQSTAAHVLNFLGFHPLFEGVVTPQDGGPVMGS